MVEHWVFFPQRHNAKMMFTFLFSNLFHEVCLYTHTNVADLCRKSVTKIEKKKEFRFRFNFQNLACPQLKTEGLQSFDLAVGSEANKLRLFGNLRHNSWLFGAPARYTTHTNERISTDEYSCWCFTCPAGG